MNIYREFEKISLYRGGSKAISSIGNDGITAELTYSQTKKLIGEYADRLSSLGIRAGDRIAIAGESCPEWNIAFMSAAKLECTSVLIDASLPGCEIINLIEKAQVRCVLASPRVYGTISAVNNVPILDITDKLSFFKDSSVSAGKVCENADKKVAVIIFSSGTTKTASGIMHYHDTVIKSARMCIDANKLSGKDRYLGILPNSHIYGLFAQVIAPMLTGAQVGFVQSLTAQGLTSAFSCFKPTVIPAVPKIYDLLKTQIQKKIESDKKSAILYKTAFPLCLKIRKVFGINLGKKLFKRIHDAFGGEARILCSAGSPMSKETCEFYFGTGFNILNSYGATETNIPTIGNYGKNITVSSAGKPYPDVKLKIAPSGELLLKSPYFMKGYFNDEAADKEAFTKDGWFRTGDLGEFDKHGNVVILGRCKENIVLATGKKAAPDDIEKAYKGIAGVEELVVCGIPVEDGSFDTVHAFVAADPIYHASIYEELMKRSSSLAAAMKLSGIHFVESIPKTSLQKPKRYLLKKLVLEDKLDTLNDNKKSVRTDSTDIAQLVINAVAKAGNVSPSAVKMSTKFLREYTIDSLSAVELALEIESFSGVRIDDAIDKDMTVAKLIGLIQNPKMIKRTSIKSIIYPLDKSAIDYKIYRFYRNLVRTFYKVKIKNDSVLPEDRGYIICANHVSNFDYLYITQNFKRERFNKFCCMAKKELFKNKFINRLMIKVAGMVPVDRTGSAGDAINALKEKLKDSWGVLIHPEGTRSKDGKIGKFKKGAALLSIETKSPIVPAYIKGGHEIYPPNRKLPHLFNWKKLKKYDVEVIYGEPIDPEGMTPETLTAKVQKAVETLAEKTKNTVEKSKKLKKTKSKRKTKKRHSRN
ncbi:AMP-binding protein [Ruminococcus sp. Marseille-P6503]|uniref:AMP-binding protein n=1 Tax=Ruminococcus sp. Marseille-P6503 TaxID=2364796 RepID=UPI000F5446E8|nr:AMP-binding protein [Ruminococcus sp. Marseille-P6503]